MMEYIEDFTSIHYLEEIVEIMSFEPEDITNNVRDDEKVVSKNSHKQSLINVL